MSDIVEQLRDLSERKGSPFDQVLFHKAADEIERLRAIVDRLPVTADGVRVALGDFVYSPSGRRHRVHVATTIDPEPFDYYIPEAMSINGEWSDIRVSQCYSTREAAEAAAKVQT